MWDPNRKSMPLFGRVILCYCFSNFISLCFPVPLIGLVQKIQIIRFSVAFDRLNSLPEIEFLYIYLTKYSSILLHAIIHNLSTGGI
jgi:hypothetical protein